MIVVFAAMAPVPVDAEPVQARFVEAEIVSSVKTVTPGTSFWVALRLAMDPEFHTYWENPGDTGLPTTLEWNLPKGFKPGRREWPYPHRFESSSYVSYGYTDEVLILQEIVASADLTPGSSAYLEARADWTVCKKDLCLPGGADLGLEIDTTDGEAAADGYWSKRFDETRRHVPLSGDQLGVKARADGESIVVSVSGSGGHDPGPVQLFARTRGAVEYGASPTVSRDGEKLEIGVPLRKKNKRDEVELVLVAANGWKAGGTPEAIEISVAIP